jgi:Delta14-sterol reductase
VDGLLLDVTPATLLRATLMLLGFFAAQFIGALLLPGKREAGFPTPTGEVLTYKLNGLAAFVLTPVALLIWCLGFGGSLTPVLGHFWSLLIVANVFVVGVLIALMIRGRAAAGDSVLRDLWFGRELNPSVLGVDLKMFFYQPSLIGLFVIVMAFAGRQHEVYGSLSPQMILFVGFWWLYLLTHYIRESFMLSTWDILAEKFGFMLVWGDTVYVPFFYSICGWWLIDYREPWAVWAVILVAVVHFAGHFVFRTANWQKDDYKRDPTALIWGRPPKTVGRLLISGWWGIGRHLNYTGEIVVYLSFALCTGAQSLVPYVLPISLVVLLGQRAARDDRRCREKYGETWERYCEQATFRMIPFIY